MVQHFVQINNSMGDPIAPVLVVSYLTGVDDSADYSTTYNLTPETMGPFSSDISDADLHELIWLTTRFTITYKVYS